ncbi:response regulator [Butyrivibrio sp. CB08]|nr:response regulator [Butyrivibrio sp. CB08]
MATAIFNGFNHKDNCIYYEKTMVHELEIEKAVAEEATRAKSSFLANMSHEIRTPINAVLGMNEMILRESMEPNVVEYAQNVRTAGNTLLGLINNILDFSKIEAGKLEIVPVEYDMSSVINDLVNVIQTKADSKDLKLKLDINENMPKLLFGDEVRIKQIITNILTNAVKYTESGSVTFGADFAKIDDEPDQVYLDISVKDTGIGIKPEDMEKLFTEFERIEVERNRNIEGTGLGMNITMQLLQMMGSKLQVESTYGEGSKFFFRLKQKVTSWDPLGDYEASYLDAMSGQKRYHEKFTAPRAFILVVDDTETNLDVFKSLLKRTKMHIDTAGSGDEALKLSKENKYDMIFMDHMMPDKDGIQTFHELRADAGNPNLDTPTLCLTANAISGAKEMYLAEGFDDYLTKPIDVDRLEEMLIQYLPAKKVVMATESDIEEEEEKAVPLPEWILSCDGIDHEAGVKNCGGTEDFLNVLTGFFTSITTKSDEIEKYYKEGDIKNYTIKVHALKSSARIVGAAELSEQAKLLEAAGKDDNISYIDEKTGELLAHYRSYLDILSPLSEGDEDLPEIPSDMLEDAYGGLMEFVSAQDFECVRMVMDSVKEYKLPSVDRERFDKIQALLSNMDWDGIKEILAERNS